MLCGARSVGVDPVLPLRDVSRWLALGPEVLGRASVNTVMLPGPQGAARMGRSDARPRVSWVRRAHPEPEWDEMARLLPGLPLDEAFVEGVAEPRELSMGRASVVEDSPQRIEVRLESTGPGMVLFTERVERGWSAALDGASVPIRRADGLFMAVEVGQRSKGLVLTYSDPLVRWSLWLAGVAWVVGLVMVVSRMRS